MKSLKESKQLKHLCLSQPQAIIKLLKKSNKDKRYISNWRPIPFLNFDLKIISKSLAIRVERFFQILLMLDKHCMQMRDLLVKVTV